MTGERRRVAIVTGASSGVGKQAAKTLAAQGWEVIAVGRDPERSALAEREIAAVAQARVTMLRADLSMLADARRLAAEVAALTDRVDVLVNNAGGMASAHVVTDEGLEQNFAGNHLGPFLLTLELLPLLRRAAADAPAGTVRIVNTASDASEMIDVFDFDDLQQERGFDAGLAYRRAKLANVAFARALGERLAPDGIVAHAVHPGTVASNFSSHAGERTQAYIATLPQISEADGADTVIWLATAAEPGRSTGGYWYERAPRTPNPLVDDPAFVRRLWEASGRIVRSVAG